MKYKKEIAEISSGDFFLAKQALIKYEYWPAPAPSQFSSLKWLL
jgi:hypothetical protein